MKSIDAISRDYEGKSAVQGYQNSQLANSRVRAYNVGWSYRHLDPRVISSMVAKEKKSTTASRLENIMSPKWFERPMDYKIMSNLNEKKHDRVLDLIDSRGNRT